MEISRRRVLGAALLTGVPRRSQAAAPEPPPLEIYGRLQAMWEDEDHWLLLKASRNGMLRTSVAFLLRHNPPC